MSELAARISALSPEKQRLLELLAKRQGKAAASAPARALTEPFSLVQEADRAKLPPEVEDAYPLTMVQLGMLYHMDLTPDASTPAYHNVNSFGLRLPLDVPLLEEAVQRVIRRHPILRTAFALTGYSEPLQLVYRSAYLHLQVEDLRHLPREERMEVIGRFIEKENRRLVDLSQPPLIRFHVHRREDDGFQFTLTEPHAISDGWSTMLTLSDILDWYMAALRGESRPDAPPLGVTYRDFVYLERQALQSAETRRFWTAKLAALPVERLPRLPGPRLGTAEERDHKPTFEIGRGVVERLERLARLAEAPIKTVLLTAHLKVMGLLAGSPGVVTGLTTHGRPEGPDGEQVRGLFLNTLPFHVELPEGVTWEELVRHVFAAELEVMPHRRFPLAALQRLRGGQVLFESAFSYLHFHSVRGVVRGGLGMTDGHSDLSVTHFPLAATFVRDPVDDLSISLTLERNDPGLSASQVWAIQGYFRSVLEVMAADPAARHDVVSLLDGRERQQVLVEWGGPGLPFPATEGLHQRFARVAAERGDARAAGGDGGSLSYRQLDRRANRLAHRLRGLGIGPEVRVGLCFERTPSLLVALLGVLKAGGVYVPMDPAYPRARLEYLLRDSGARVVVTEEHLAGVLPEFAGEVLALGETGEEDSPPEAAVGPDHAAYVIYTSGSTGDPKGVVVTHGNAVRLLDATRDWFGFGPDDVWTLFHSYAFDFSVWEIWGALLYGGRLVVVPQAVSRAPEVFRRLLAEERVTVLNQTPSAFRQLAAADAEMGEQAGPLHLRLVIFGGEALDPASLVSWMERHGDGSPRLVNMYGITETTVHVTYRPLTLEQARRETGSPIGMPIPDLRTYVLDPHQQPVPAGVAGELCVGGAGVARGYLGRPALTAQRFVPDPFGGDAGARLYRSGDLARHRLTGELEYLGRIDSQVKVRGFRIELGEVEAALAAHPGIRAAAVLPRRDPTGDTRLLAFLAMAGDAPPAVEEIRAFLAARLPEHAVPAVYASVESLPLTAHGKLDRRALAEHSAALDLAQPALGAAYVAPRTPAEQALVDVWQEVLGVARVGVEDNFFALGGDSIRSIQVVAKARDRGIELSVQQLFQTPTVAGLATSLSSSAPAAAAAVRTRPFELVSEEDRAKLPPELEDAYPLSKLQAGMLFHMDLLAEAPPYHNVESFHLLAPFSLKAFREAVRRVAARHAVLRTSFALTGYSEPLQLVHRQAELPIEVEDLTGLDAAAQERRVDELLAQEKRSPFDLTRVPQFRFFVLLRGESFQLTFTENHAIFDGWSLYSTLTEIFRHYSALLAGRPLPEEPPPAIPYREFIALEREALRSVEARQYWEGLLADASFLELPRWREPRAVTVGGSRMRVLPVPLTLEASTALQRHAAGAGLPVKSLLLAAHLKALSRVSGQTDILTGTVMNGRPEVEGGEETRGLFLNTLPFRMSIRGGTWLDLAREVFAAEQAALPFRRFPMSELQNAGGGRPLFQTIFNYTHFHVVEEVIQRGEVMVLGFKKSTDTNFALTAGATLEPSSRRLTLELAVDTAEMPLEQIEAVAEVYHRALEAIAADPETRHDLDALLSPAERQQIVAEWNDTAADYDRARTLHGLFEARTALSPEAPAVIAEDGTLTYRELDRWSNRIARHLRSVGVEPGDLVGVYLERSVEMVPALLGILKTGGAYVPLAADWPEARLQWILGSLGVRHLVTQTARLDTVRRLRLTLERLEHAVCLDAAPVEGASPVETGLRVWSRAEVERRSTNGLGRTAAGSDLAYVIFTSGSTGHPKGVAVRHEPVVNLIDWVQATFGMGPADRVLFLTSLTFDLSVYDVFGLLAAGGSIRVASRRDLDDPERLVRLLRDEPITFWDSAPAALQQLVPLFSAVSGLEESRLRLVFLSGDWISLPLPDLVRESFPGARVVSLGGATEATVWSNWFPVAEVHPRWVSIPYGRPIRNARYHVLDEALVPLPVGAPGDLYIGGDCLSMGYFGEPVLTTRAYVPDPFAEEPGARLYRTGDRARRWPDGTLEFLGRLDSQVKIRGYRIELGEIESVLARHPEVRDPVVLAREDVPGQRRLVAYYVPRQEPGPDPAALRGFLEDELPDYMVPAVLVSIPAVPVTPNGKLDRAALPAPEIDRTREGAGFVAPRTRLESVLAAAWADLLGRPEVGVHDDFFELGGQSLLAIQLVARLRESFRLELPLRALFDHPTVAELAAFVGDGAVPDGPLAPLPAALPQVAPEPGRLHDPFPLTDLQQAYWLGQRTDYDLGGVSAHVYEELEVPDLDTGRFEAAWRRLIERHPMLRALVLPDGRFRILESPPPFQVEELDLRGVEPERAEAAVADVRRRMAEQGPATDRWPLFEVRVSRLDGGCRIHVSLSLLVSDAVSGQVLTRELVRLYADPAAALPPLEITFRDYVEALGAFEGSVAFQESLAYWTRRLPELPPAPELPLVAERRREASFVRRSWSLDAPAWSRLKERATRAGVTPTIAVLAAYSEVLAVWSKSPRFTVNVLYFNRPPLHPQIQELVGNFSSTLLLAVEADAGDGFERRAQQLQERLWQDLEHGRVSGVRVVRELARLQGASTRPVMPVVFTSDLNLVRAEAEAPAGAASGIRSISSSGSLQTPQVWLDHQVSEREGRLVVNWDVAEALFPPGMMDDMFAAYGHLLTALGTDDAAWSAGSPALLPAAHLALEAAANDTAAPLPDGLLHTPFLERARQHPGAPAVLAPDATLTYGEIDRLAGRLGSRLAALGAGPGRLVAVVMEKGWRQVPSALGVLRAGAAYLPIDPEVPAERLAYLLAAGGVELAVTHGRWRDGLDWPAGVRLLILDELGDEDGAALPSAQTPDDLAYVIFTSGSTGRPKGVAIEHRAALNTIADINRRFGVGPEDRALALSSLSFDLSVYDLFGLLAAGGAVVIPDAAAQREPAHWADLLARHRVTVWNSVPALMEMLVDHLEGRGEILPASLRLVLLSGDWIPVSLPDRIRRLGPDVQVVSLGGATEASIWSILHPIAFVDPAWSSIPYGRPMANQTFQVLDEALRPRPVWVPGELYIGGAGLARGYWGDAEKTGAAFLADPRSGGRLYRTGDLGRRLPDGTLEFLGREDLQVKVQGYRIELGEIEAALLAHPEVRAGVVTAVGPRRGAKRLVAYAVPAGEGVDVEEVRRFLAAKLPSYMVPAALVLLDELPLTANGKVDRKALPDPEGGRASRLPVPPRDELEEALARIWAGVLGDLAGDGPVSVRDDFFELGGHSLLAVRLMGRIQAELGRELPLSALFSAPTVEALAGLLRQAPATSAGVGRPALVEVQPGGPGLPFFCVHPVGGNVLCYRDLARELGTGQPFYALQTPDPAPASVEEMAAVYLDEMRQVQPHGPYRLGGWSMGGVLAYEMARQLERAGEEVELLAMIDPWTPGLVDPAAVDDAVLASWFLGDLGGLTGVTLAIDPDELRPLDPGARAALLLERAQEAHVLPPDFGLAELSRHLETFQRNFRALLEHVPGEHVGSPLLFLAADGGSADHSADVWARLATGAEIHLLSGDHYTIVRPPRVAELAQALATALAPEMALP